jgi:hypothetical protein
MANETYTLIQKTTLNASAATIEFTSIPQTFTDLTLVLSLRTTGVGGSTGSIGQITFNSSTSGYSEADVYGQQGSAGSGGYSPITTYIPTGRDNNALLTANTFSSCSVYIPNYTSANFKSVSLDSASENNSINASMAFIAGLWSNTAAINAITITSGDGNYVQYSSVSLYGVAKEGVTPVAGPKASGGDIITNDGTYWIHQFLNSGTFTPSSTLSCDYLVVAGGGGGTLSYGGGGGAGGLRSTVTATGGGGSLETALSVTAQPYTITIGAGGAGRTDQTLNGNDGTNSVFSSVTASGGGGAGAGYSGGPEDGRTGGSGGGAGGVGAGTVTKTGGARTASPVQGNVGGNTSGTAPGGGGGGGAGAAGSNASSTYEGGNGGAGSASSITGTSVTRAGGGGGGAYTTQGTGGSGGGGTGGNYGSSLEPTAGTANTGGGGGGGRPAGTLSGSGGSGIVIIRYAM